MAFVSEPYDGVRGIINFAGGLRLTSSQCFDWQLTAGMSHQGAPPAEWAKLFPEDLKRYAEICRIAKIEPQ